MSATDLLGDVLGDGLPENEQLQYSRDLAGHKIKAAIHSPCGIYRCELLIVTETGCWLALDTEADGCGEDASIIEIQPNHYGKERLLSDYASATDLLTAGVINSGEHELLRKAEVIREESQKADRAARLRAELAKIDGSTS